MANEHVLMTIPTETKSDAIEVSIIFNDGASQSWAGDEIEKGYHLHVNAVSLVGDNKRIRPFTGLRRFLSPSEEFKPDDIKKLDLRTNIITNLAYSVARANDLSISKDGASIIRDFKNNAETNTLILEEPQIVH